jgi:hypothetical protein
VEWMIRSCIEELLHDELHADDGKQRVKNDDGEGHESAEENEDDQVHEEQQDEEDEEEEHQDPEMQRRQVRATRTTWACMVKLGSAKE